MHCCDGVQTFLELHIWYCFETATHRVHSHKFWSAFSMFVWLLSGQSFPLRVPAPQKETQLPMWHLNNSSTSLFSQYTPKGALAYCCQQMQILAQYIILQLGSFLKPLGCKPGSLDPNCWLRKELQPLLSWFWPCPPQLSVQQVPEWAKKVGCRTAGNFRCYHLVLECHTPYIGGLQSMSP